LAPGFVARLGRLDLLCLDELGYVQLDPRGPELTWASDGGCAQHRAIWRDHSTLPMSPLRPMNCEFAGHWHRTLWAMPGFQSIQ